MIPTTYKDRLPRQFAYPARAAQLTSALADVPQFATLTLSFHRYPAAAADFNRSISSGEPYPVVICRYARPRVGLSECNELAERGFYDPRWELYVYPVLENVGAVARAQLAAFGLPALRSWLREPRSELWLQASHEFVLRFSTSACTVSSPMAV